MKDEHTIPLLEDLARLLKKHGPDAFDELAELLESPRFSEMLTKILRTTSASGRTIGTRRSEQSQAAAPDSILDEIKNQDPEKYAELVQIQEKLVRSKALSRLRDVVNLADQLQIPLQETRNRKQVVDAIFQALLTCSIDELRDVAKRIAPQSSPSTLQAWSDIILPKDNR